MAYTRLSETAHALVAMLDKTEEGCLAQLQHVDHQALLAALTRKGLNFSTNSFLAADKAEVTKQATKPTFQEVGYWEKRDARKRSIKSRKKKQRIRKRRKIE